MLYYLSPSSSGDSDTVVDSCKMDVVDKTADKSALSAIRLARSCMECQEFDRAAEFLSGFIVQDSVAAFLHYYARYLVGILL